FGPLLGGVLTDAASWRWVLFLNLPVAAIAVLVTRLEVPADKGSAAHERVDYAGVATLTLGLVALLVALDQSTDWGWTDPRILGLLAVCVGGLLSFVAIERRAGRNALVPRDVFSSRAFVAAAGCVLLVSATFFAVLLYVPQVMQKLLGFTPLQAGFGFLPMMAIFAAVSFVAGPLYDRFGGKLIICAGAGGLPVGVFLLSLAGASRYWTLVPGVVLLGIGLGLFYSTITAAAVTALDAARSSLAGGIIYMCQIAGGAVGLGLTTTVFTRVADAHVRSQAVADRLSSAQEHAVGHVLTGNETGQQLLTAFPGAAAQLERVAHDAFLAGVQAAFRLDAALAFGGFLVALLFVGGPLRLPSRRRRLRSGMDPHAAEPG
ncbi:MAG: MFS transporter, partial [Nocardioidaceae bacterium]